MKQQVVFHILPMPTSLAATLSLLEKTLPIVFPDNPTSLALTAVINPEEYPTQAPAATTMVLAVPEMATLASYTLPKRRAQWFTGRICAKQAISKYIRRFVPQLPIPDARDITIRNLPSGRPEINSLLAAICGLDLSISHSGGYATALVSPSACGIDIQEDSAKLVRISDRFCQKNEVQILQHHLPNLYLIPQLNLLWTAKEAARKAVIWERTPGFLEMTLHRCEPISDQSILLVLYWDSSTPQLQKDLFILATRFAHFSLSILLTNGKNAHA